MEQEMLNIAIENLSLASKIKVEVDQKDLNFDYSNGGHLNFFLDNKSFRLAFTIKRKVSTAQLPFLKDLANHKGLIIFEYATKTIKEQLRNLRVNYLEISGNAYIVYENTFIFIDTNKRVKLDDSKSNTAFSKTGLKVTYQLLSNRESIHLSYRQLGQLSGVSIDTISRVYKELVRDKYLIKINDRNYKIIDYDRLFMDWVTLYNKILRPKLKKRSFRFRDKRFLRDLLDHKVKGKISGELAAEKLSDYIIAEKANIYLAGSFVDLALSLNLIPDKDGPITMIEQFWNEPSEKVKSDTIADLPLIYADLVSDPKPRNLETAKLIYQENVYHSI